MKSLIAATLILTALATPSFAQQRQIVQLHGTVTERNASRFFRFIDSNMDKLIGLYISAEPTNEKKLNNEKNYEVNVTWKKNEGGGEILGSVIISLNLAGGTGSQSIDTSDGVYWLHGSGVIEGFYIVKNGGMMGGRIYYDLKPVDESQVRLGKQRIVRAELK